MIVGSSGLVLLVSLCRCWMCLDRMVISFLFLCLWVLVRFCM